MLVEPSLALFYIHTMFNIVSLMQLALNAESAEVKYQYTCWCAQHIHYSACRCVIVLRFTTGKILPRRSIRVFFLQMYGLVKQTSDIREVLPALFQQNLLIPLHLRVDVSPC